MFTDLDPDLLDAARLLAEAARAARDRLVAVGPHSKIGSEEICRTCVVLRSLRLALCAYEEVQGG